MAELRVEPKKKTSFFPWLLLAMGLIALVVFLSRRSPEGTTLAEEPVASTTPDKTVPSGASDDAGWKSINRNAPGLAYGEIKTDRIKVSGTENYAVYDLGEDVLFDKEQSTIRQKAGDNLQQVAASINQRFNNGAIRLYGFTDAQGSKSFNQQLAEDRAEAVKKWLVNEAHISAERISVEAKGASEPVATNNTEAGRKENRRVQIIVKKAS